MLNAFPLLLLPVAIYNLAVLAVMGGLKSATAQAHWAEPMMTAPMPTGGRWTLSYADMLVFVSLVLLFIELLKSTTSRRTAIINHSLSMILFIVCLVEFLLFAGFSTSAFFLLTTMVLLDVLAGFIVTLASSRREIDFVD